MSMQDIDEVLASMLRGEAISDLDLHFARLMARADEQGGVSLAASMALLSASSERGRTSVTVEEIVSLARAWLSQSACRDIPVVLDRSPICGDGDPPTPVVIDGGLVYLYRYWDYERRLVAALLLRNRPADVDAETEPMRAGLERLFPAADGIDVDWQKVATALAMLRRLTIISGGPGTGKTSTVVRLLALILEMAGEGGCRIALAAPTGKAAARMQQAIESARDGLRAAAAVIDAIPRSTSTLHRLLGARPHGGGFRHGVDNPLAIDVLVVDEVSMVDLALMTRLLEAVPAHARVILLGDRDQLASVEPGSVFADLCLGADRFSSIVSSHLEALTGYPMEAAISTPLADACVVLKQSYRFSDDSGVGRLAVAIRGGDGEAVRSLLDGAGSEQVGWHSQAGGEGLKALVRDRVVSVYRPRLEAVRRGMEPDALFTLYTGMQMLCAVRRGESGVVAMNVAIESELARAGLIDPTDHWYMGRPLMITANDYNLDLFNGDMGIVLGDPTTGAARACFMPQGGEPRWLHPARLPPHETAWALTIHKSQGSEFDDVIVVLPGEDSPLLTRELIYTAVTRARRRVELWATPASVAASVSRRTHRQSGLARRLAEAGAGEHA